MAPNVRIDDTGDEVPKPWPGGQTEFAADWTHRYVGLEAGWGAGKTHIGARKLLTLHQLNAFDADGMETGVKSAQISPTLTLAKDFAIPMLEEGAEEFGMRSDFRVMSRDGDMLMAFLGSSNCFAPIMIRSAEHPERIAGWQVGAIWGDEPSDWKTDRHNPKRNAYIQLTGRLRDPRARFLQAMFTWTNEGDHTFIYEEFHSGKPDHAVYRASTRDNPLMADFYERQRLQLTPELAQQYLEGKAANLSGGLIYSQFLDRLHVDDTLVLDPALPLQMSVDFNITPGMHALLGQYRQAEDLFTVTHEIHGPRMDVREIVVEFEKIVDSLGGWKWPELEVFGDATGTSGWAGTGETCYTILRGGLQSLGYPFRVRVPRQNPPVVDRVNAFNVALKDLAGNIHWKCRPECQRLITDMRELRRDARGEINKSERYLSHASDAEGYRIHYLRPARVVREPTAGRIATVPRA